MSLSTIVAATTASALVAYLVYFDHQRRNAPDYREKLIARRREERKAARRAAHAPVPDMNDREALQAYFVEQMRLGEDTLTAGNFGQCVKHFANAIRVCQQPTQMLQVFQQSLPPAVFRNLILELDPSYGQQSAPADQLE
ncbi:hypothetical protein CAOG_01504 [Capsaspora owczarzaki ATCC 30864]|uniref:Mitochondrial import receptor subunit TOM20 n=1 Tax=Capsaspora owczarzaki (strain ATCC 30864) TaxID=595528 RepID=A0A0D2VJL0_CAPO3|nr:hypothetical protein CAOG_01504 [Capsaspora owczarzaki ATCC 30864]KJE90157.1 hypothetical protein CAOG_001504 [Capsaspora owczarzaki ATCC 30864]|eukprot:XP_004364372.1 hypothetical protein CAOG_01504 [Capsaspora owczarzaki ATCC 30864]